MLHKIKDLCKEKDISLAELERKADIAEKSIFRWDKVKPSAEKVAKVANILGTTVEDLLKEE